MNHWDKIKIPPVGMSDGMVAFKNGRKEREYEDFREEILKEIQQEAPEFIWSWVSYDESIKKRVAELKESGGTN